MERRPRLVGAGPIDAVRHAIGTIAVHWTDEEFARPVPVFSKEYPFGGYFPRSIPVAANRRPNPDPSDCGASDRSADCCSANSCADRHSGDCCSTNHCANSGFCNRCSDGGACHGGASHSRANRGPANIRAADCCSANSRASTTGASHGHVRDQEYPVSGRADRHPRGRLSDLG